MARRSRGTAAAGSGRGKRAASGHPGQWLARRLRAVSALSCDQQAERAPAEAPQVHAHQLFAVAGAERAACLWSDEHRRHRRDDADGAADYEPRGCTARARGSRRSGGCPIATRGWRRSRSPQRAWRLSSTSCRPRSSIRAWLFRTSARRKRRSSSRRCARSRRTSRLTIDRSVVDARILAGMDHADDVHAIRRSALQGVHVLAREEDHVAGTHRRSQFSFQMTPSPDTITSASS